MFARELKDIAVAAALIAGLYIAWKIYQGFAGDSDDGYEVTDHFADGVRLPDGRVINVIREMLDASNVFPYQGILYRLAGSSAIRAPANTRYHFRDGGTAIQNVTGFVTFVE